MRLERTETGWLVTVPDDVVAALRMSEGDEVVVSRALPSSDVLTDPAERQVAIERIRAMARPLPADYAFDREEANAR